MVKVWGRRSPSPPPSPTREEAAEAEEDLAARAPDPDEAAFLARLATGGVKVQSQANVTAQVQAELDKKASEQAPKADAKRKAQAAAKSNQHKSTSKRTPEPTFDIGNDDEFDAAFGAAPLVAPPARASGERGKSETEHARLVRLGMATPFGTSVVAPNPSALKAAIGRASARTAELAEARARTTVLPANVLPAPPPEARAMQRAITTGVAGAKQARQAEQAARIAQRQRRERESAMRKEQRCERESAMRKGQGVAPAPAVEVSPSLPPKANTQTLRAADTGGDATGERRPAKRKAPALHEQRALAPPPPPRRAAVKAFARLASSVPSEDQNDSAGSGSDSAFAATDASDSGESDASDVLASPKSSEDDGVDAEANAASKRGKRRTDMRGSRKNKRQKPRAPAPPASFLPHHLEDGEPEMVFEGGFKIPRCLWDKLFVYQRTGVQWLTELHVQRAGGIVGDEMGLGKTIQICALLVALHRSGLYKPSLIVCPATVMAQWKSEVEKWCGGLFDVCIMHSSALKKHGAGYCDVAEDEEAEDDVEPGANSGALVVRPASRGKGTPTSRNTARTKRLAAALRSPNGLVITTYGMVRMMRDQILPVRWGYVILDEGHKIRNPDADVTITCKCLKTVHRIILSGAPIQNHLTELWSLFDFIFPGRLGTLPVFQAQFALPIQIGGYTNASPAQVQTAFQCSMALRDLITPYLLRRMKCDVLTMAAATDSTHLEAGGGTVLPKKTEQVLFCSLTPEQLQTYRRYLASKEVVDILEGDDVNVDGERRSARRRSLLAAIDMLKKICNHPDLLDRVTSVVSADEDYGNVQRSGKLMVLDQILQEWHAKGHRCLIFTQTQQMLDIIEAYIFNKYRSAYTYRRMDGSTAVERRASLMAEFNAPDSNIFLFLLTTRVGGLGTNLIGADRVVIFDPDWNPSTDTQARERAWRIGQTKEVTIYRLITTGTIEEKIYHRQIYKSLLTEKVLRDPRQKRLFSSRDLRDLFSLGAEYESVPVTQSSAGAGASGKMHAMRGGGGLETMQIFGDALEEERRRQGAGAGKRSKASAKDAWGIEVSDDDDAMADEVDEKEPEDSAANGGELANASQELNTENARKETEVLDKLLRSSVANAVDHDVVVTAGIGEGGGIAQDGIRAEAARSARLATQAVRTSAEACARSGGVHVPTWTGRSGAAGAPGGAPPRGMRFGGEASAGILAQIRARTDAASAAAAAAARDRL